jgi:hypothetical protein
MIRWRPLLVLISLVLLAVFRSAPPAAAQLPEPERVQRIQGHLREILSGQEFQWKKPEPTILERAGKWIGERLEQFFDALGRLFRFSPAPETGAGELFFWMIYVALVGGLILLLAWLLTRLARRLSERRADAAPRKRPAVASQVVEPEETVESDPEAWLETARQYAESGDYRRAYRAVFLAMLIRLDRTGAIHFDRARTNGEYLRALRSRPPLLTLFLPLARDFDARWYGSAPVTEQDYRRLLESYAAVSSAGA